MTLCSEKISRSTWIPSDEQTRREATAVLNSKRVFHALEQVLLATRVTTLVVLPLRAFAAIVGVSPANEVNE